VESELARLESLPKTEGHWQQVGTGRTWATEWQHADTDQRRAMLRDADLSFLVGENGARVHVAVAGSRRIDRTEAARRFAGGAG
jgi:hypothetical protein